jgi:hypothetical protein
MGHLLPMAPAGVDGVKFVADHRHVRIAIEANISCPCGGADMFPRGEHSQYPMKWLTYLAGDNAGRHQPRLRYGG